MKSIKLYIILPLFGIALLTCTGLGYIVYEADICRTSAINGYIDSDSIETDTELGILSNPVAANMRTMRSGSFIAGGGGNNIAGRTPVQYFKVRSGQCIGLRGGYWQNWKKKLGYKVIDGVKSLILGSSGVSIPYHEAVSVLRSCHFSKCYILALGKLLC